MKQLSGNDFVPKTILFFLGGGEVGIFVGHSMSDSSSGANCKNFFYTCLQVCASDLETVACYPTCPLFRFWICFSNQKFFLASHDSLPSADDFHDETVAAFPHFRSALF